jgi:hypothetical protein
MNKATRFSRHVNSVFVVMALVSSGSCAAQNTGSADIVYKIYQDYGWESLFGSPGEGARVVKRPLVAQPAAVLQQIFDGELTSLLLKEARCLKQTPGALCNLEFSPIFASQDSGASDLTINGHDHNKVVVQFIYPSTGQKMQLTYLMRKTPRGWRVVDIVYPAPEASLKTILRR